MRKRTQSQIGKLSRRKGKSFENWCARYFTKWTGLKWESTRNSGRTDLKGDIYCVSRPDLPLIVECKHDKRYSIHAMLKSTKVFTNMMKKVGRYEPDANGVIYPGDVWVIIKNNDGIWMTQFIHRFECEMNNIIVANGKDWHRLESFYAGQVDGINFGGH